MSILLACFAMAVKDALATFLVIAESKNRPLMAACFDAGYDIAWVLVTVLGAGNLIVNGLTVHGLTILGAMCTTSFFGTLVWTRIGHRLTS